MFDIIVVGAGVAGMTASLYALRNNKSVLLLDKDGYGGQIAKSPKVENYPTIKSISGSELSDMIFNQITDLGVKFELEDVERIDKFNQTFVVKTNYKSYEGKSIIIANGVTPRKLNLENEEKFLGKGVYYCAICDGPFFTNKEVVLVGDGNTAMQYALMLADYCSKVTVVTMLDKFFGEKHLEDMLRKNEKIKITPNAEASKLIGEDKLDAVEFISTNKEKFVIKTDALFVAIGQVADNNRFSNLVDLDKDGYIISDENCKTKTSGLFVAGDSRTKSIRQVVTAIGDGAVAGSEAIKYLASLK